MPFDAFMTSALTSELSDTLCGLKVDKICQPERDEVDLIFHRRGDGRLVISCAASTPFMALSSETKENPQTPPMMCMLLRKHLSRAKITSVSQIGFDRTICIEFDSGDEMGYQKTKYLFCEMMGRGSNLIFADENKRILAAFHQNDITTKFDRVIMVGMNYVPMPPQDKIDPMTCNKETFFSAFRESADQRTDLVFQKKFSGFGKLTAREIVYRASGDPEASVASISLDALWNEFSSLITLVSEKHFAPCLIYESREAFEKEESPLDYSFFRITQFSKPFYVSPCASVSEAIESYYRLRNKDERHKQHYNDIHQILKTCIKRLEKKISAQTVQLHDSKDAEDSRKKGDLVMQEMYRIRKGDSFVVATDYSTEEPSEIKISLDTQLSPSQNAQRYYREYAKKKTAYAKMLEQIDIANAELRYANSVLASLNTASTSEDLAQIRRELSHWSYGRRLTSSLKKPGTKKEKASPKETRSENGFRILVGMNNFQNDTVSTALCEKNDLWFHVKNYHGSHVLLKASGDRVFENEDLEYAASLAAYYSEVSSSDRVEVDYTEGRHVKKPNGSKPGFVTYKNHKTVIVTPKKLK